MQLSRRQALALGVSGAALALGASPALAAKSDLLDAFTGGAAAGAGDLVLIAPEIAENGNSVTIEFECPGAEEVRIFALENPNPEVCTVRYGPLAGNTRVVTRIRMAGTQEVIALARMQDGSFREARAMVRVTIGGCGG